MRLVSCLIKRRCHLDFLNFCITQDARRSRGEWGRGARGWQPQSSGSGLDVTPLSLGNLLVDVMRRRGDTCASLRAALVQLRVANGVKWGRGRKEVEALERQNAALSSPLFGGGPEGGLAGTPGRTTRLPLAHLKVGSCEPPEGGRPAVPSAGEKPAAAGRRGALAAHQTAQKQR